MLKPLLVKNFNLSFIAKPLTMKLTYQGNLLSGAARIDRAVNTALENTRRYAIPLVQSRTPVKTGKLKASWDGVSRGQGLEITNSADYATFVELGTSHMAPRLMLTRSLPAITDYFAKELAYQTVATVEGRFIAKSPLGGFLGGIRATAKIQGTKPVTPRYRNG